MRGKKRQPSQQSGKPVQERRAPVREDAADDLALDEELQRLREPGGRFSALLNRTKVADGDAAAQELGCKQVRGRNRILNREIDADAADRRHRVRGIADAEQPRPIPLPQTIHAHRQQLDVVPACELADAIGQERHDRADLTRETLPSRAGAARRASPSE